MESPDAARAAPAIAGSDPRKSSCLAADGSKFNPNHDLSQGKNRHSPAVAEAIERNHKRLLAIKRGSILSFLNAIDASLELTSEAAGNLDDDQMLEHGARLIANARGFAKLLANFRDTREASQ